VCVFLKKNKIKMKNVNFARFIQGRYGFDVLTLFFFTDSKCPFFFYFFLPRRLPLPRRLLGLDVRVSRVVSSCFEFIYHLIFVFFFFPFFFLRFFFVALCARRSNRRASERV
jgi:hypothetical protein